MSVLQHIADLLNRVRSYAWWEVLLELAFIWGVVFVVVRFVQGTRAAGALKGLLLVFLVLALVVWILGGGETFMRLGYLFDRVLGVVALGLIVIFQPELRRALIRLGEAPFFRSTQSDLAGTIEAITEASSYLSKARFGALIVLERQVGLEHLVEGGTKLDAQVSSRLLSTIFFPGSALHDLAVLIRGRVVHAANVQLPMAEAADMPDPSLGARHRAALGLSRECDAIVVVVSEETGAIRLAERGRLSAPLSGPELAAELTRRLRRTPPSEGLTEAESEAVEPDPALRETQAEEGARA
ncbi:MAG: diadenylate cyclase CdaA [Planctomycetota bacterium]